MKIKKFLIQFTSDTSTKWRSSDDQIARTLEIICRSVGHGNTTGSVPQVNVVVEEATPKKCGCVGSNCQ